ncbi:MAG: ATP-binding cassette domain-containing protein [Streptosporangiales bacterium]|nr:ATP-binding cassette domain-containing protein [Streptosporangiales bacterium]
MPAEWSDQPAIAIRGAAKRYGEITAVDGLDLVVPKGICLGLLGPNGAGKSTTMRLLTGQSRADEGRIEILGLAVPRESKQARALMGVVPQQDNLDVELTARQNLEVFARLYRVPARRRPAAVASALALAQLTDRADTRVDKLSGGMRRRLLIARGLVHEPRLVLLDEPTVGLDPQVRGDVWSLIVDLRAKGVTVLLSTHYIEEAERLCDSVALMSQGRIVVRDAPETLISRHAGEEVAEFYGSPHQLSEVEEIAHSSGRSTRRSGPAVAVLGAETLAEGGNGFGDRFGEPVRRRATLEDVFVLLTGETVE